VEKGQLFVRPRKIAKGSRGDCARDECQSLAIDVAAVGQEAGIQIDLIFGINAMLGQG
jgi:hypothetical protein